MRYLIDNSKINDYISIEKKEGIKAILIFISIDFFIIISTYLKLLEYKMLFYILIVPFFLLSIVLIFWVFSVSINKILDTSISLDINGKVVHVSFCRYRFFKRKDFVFNLQDTVIEPFIYHYKKMDYTDSYALSIKVKDRRILIVKDFFQDFDSIEKKFMESGIKFLPPSYEVKQYLKKINNEHLL